MRALPVILALVLAGCAPSPKSPFPTATIVELDAVPETNALIELQAPRRLSPAERGQLEGALRGPVMAATVSGCPGTRYVFSYRDELSRDLGQVDVSLCCDFVAITPKGGKLRFVGADFKQLTSLIRHLGVLEADSCQTAGPPTGAAPS